MQRFWDKVHRGAPDACWIWQGSRTPRGYGQFAMPSGPVGAHRVSWEIANGPVPDGLSVLHRCDVRPCVNPGHLFLGTHLDNMQDAANKGRLHVSRPKNHKVTDEQVEDIVSLVRAGMKQCDVAQRFGVSKMFVSAVVSGKRRQYRQPVVQRKAS